MKKLKLKSVRKLRDYAKRKLATRWHMSLILTGVALSGVVSSKLILLAGLEALLPRLVLAFLIAYGCFFIFIRIWIYIFAPPVPRSSGPENSPDEIGNLLDGINISGMGSGGVRAGSGGQTYNGAGGDFGGGGASGLWDDSAKSAILPAALDGDSIKDISGTSSSFELPDIDLGDSKEGLGVIVLLIALVVFIAAIFGSAIFLIYQAPVILSEALFEFVLSTGLVKKVKNLKEHDWLGSVWRATWIPALIMLVVTAGTGLALSSICPDARTLYEAVRMCIL